MGDHPKRELGKTEHHQAAEVIHKRFLGGLLMLPVMFLAGSGGDSFYKKMKGVVTGPSSKVSVKKVPRSLQDLD
ncbi:hypothetical protein FRC03_003738 [Tulasnella sp. 419]|nr:hypothetical protein FRC03_003738 [Tulasnella sp. 419]